MAAVELIEGGIHITDLRVFDDEARAIVSDCPPDAREALVGRAIKVGLILSRDAASVGKVDFVKLEFSKLRKEMEDYWKEQVKAKIDSALKDFFDPQAGTLPQTLRSYLGEGGKLEKLFDDKDSRSLPFQLKQYLGDGGKLPELFSEKNTQGVTYQLKKLLTDQLTGENSTFMKALDPNNQDGPIARLWKRIEEKVGRVENLLVKEAGAEEVKEVTPPKGGDYEDLLLPVLERIAATFGDTVVDVHNQNKPGDFLCILDPETVPGKEIKIAIDAKNKHLSLPETERVLSGSKQPWGASAAFVVFAASDQVPNSQLDPFGQIANGFVCAYEIERQEPIFLAFAYKVARLQAIREVQRAGGAVEPEAVQEKITQAAAKLRELSTLKKKITATRDAVNDLWKFVDRVQGELFGLLDEARIALGAKAPLPAVDEAGDQPALPS